MTDIRDRVRELRRVRAGDLVPNDANWRRHPDGQRRALAEALERVGFADALVARELPDGRLQLLDGHLRADMLPDQELPVLVVDLDDAEAATLLATLDPIAALAVADREALDALTATLDLPGELAAMLEAPPPAQVDPPVDLDDFPEPPAQPISKTGDLWALGEHRLLCGDTFEAADIARLIGEEQIAMVATDPPYAIYGSSTGIAEDIADDKMVRPFFEAIFRLFLERLPWFGHAYVSCDWRSWAAIWESARRAGLPARNLIVWDKGGQGLGSNYANTYELIGYFVKLPQQTAMGDRPTGQRSVHRPNLMRYERVRGAEREHNAAKPVGLYAELVSNSSDPGDWVLDPFCGSGSTLIACERTGRRCMTMDVEPKWCDVTVQRWQRLTGGEAIKIER